MAEDPAMADEPTPTTTSSAALASTEEHIGDRVGWGQSTDDKPVVVSSAMPGTAACFYFDDGDTVQANEPIAEIEAMKVFVRVESPFTGSIKYLVELGEMVGQGSPIAEITPLKEGEIDLSRIND
jgi:biotin carboxyl carrier protein